MQIFHGNEDGVEFTEAHFTDKTIFDFPAYDKYLEYLAHVGLAYQVQPPDAVMPPCVVWVPDNLDVRGAIYGVEALRSQADLDAARKIEDLQFWPYVIENKLM